MQNLERNGGFVQRRKMYIGFPMHNMRSHLKLEWPTSDFSIQDQVGSRFKLKKENEQIRKKYTDTLDRKIYHKYVEHEQDMPFAERDESINKKIVQDTLEREVEHFNSSKIVPQVMEKSQEEPKQEVNNLLQNNHQGMEKYNRNNDRLNQSMNVTETYPIQASPRIQQRQSSLEQQPYYDQEPQRDRNYSNYKYDRPYYPNPENYYTISPAPDRYRPFQPDPYQNFASPSKYVQKLVSGSVPSDYPFRNVIPDKLQNHLREKVKADRKAVKVSLNLFDYTKP